MLEKEIEAEVCKYAESKSKGIEQRKFKTPNRRNAPDRIFLLSPGLVFFIEFKRPGEKPNKGQLREHQRLRDLEFHVYVCDDIEAGKRIIDLWSPDTRRIPRLSTQGD